MSADIEKRMQGIEILLVEDSPTQVERLRHVMEAKGYRTRVARDGKKALEALRERKPNLVLSDIVMVTASSMPSEIAATFRALESGALTVIAKPPGPGHPLFIAARDELVRTIKLMAEVRVVKRWTPPRAGSASKLPLAVPAAAADVRLVAIGASTGGP
ncbi:MAG: response regulator, partial [Betaproteobacteria bacterium]